MVYTGIPICVCMRDGLSRAKHCVVRCHKCMYVWHVPLVPSLAVHVCVGISLYVECGIIYPEVSLSLCVSVS